MSGFSVCTIYLVIVLIALLFRPHLGFADETYQERMEKLREEKQHQEEINFKTGRIRTVRFLNDATVLFSLNPRTPACYQAAISNFIENVWDGFAKDYGCVSSDTLCAKDPRHRYELNKKNFHEPLDEAEQKVLIEKANTAIITDPFWNYVQPISTYLDPNQKLWLFNVNYGKPMVGPPPDEMKNRINNINEYLNACVTMKTKTWAAIGEEPPRMLGQEPKFAFYHALILNVLASQLPDDQKTVLGCLHTLLGAKTDMMNQCKIEFLCGETVPEDSKEMLTRELNELMQHQCDPRYAKQMNESDYPK